MAVLPVDSSDIYVVQTLYDGKWRLDKKFIDNDQAQHYASLLVPDWGKARVRLLVGRYDADLDRRRFFQTVMEPPLKWHQSFGKRLSGIVARSGASHTRKKAGPLIGIAALLAGVVMAMGTITSFPTEAANDIVSRQHVAQNQAPIARNIKTVFSELSEVRYAKTRVLRIAPLRLQGDWSRQCQSGHQELQIAGQGITEFDGAVPKDTILQAVFQAGQTYGLVRESGKIMVLELTSFDQLSPIGELTMDGVFSAASDKAALKRCL